MGNLGMSTFLTSMLEGMNRAQQSQAELTDRKEKLKFEQDRLKLQEREMEMKYKENPFDQLTKELDLEYKTAQTKKAQFDLVEGNRKAQEAQALREVQGQAKNDLSLLDEYFTTQGIKPQGGMKDRYYQLAELAGNSPDQIRTMMETKGLIPRYKPESPKEDTGKLGPRPSHIAKRLQTHMDNVMVMSKLGQMSPEQQEAYKNARMEEYGAEFDKLAGLKTSSGGGGGGKKVVTPAPTVGGYPDGSIIKDKRGQRMILKGGKWQMLK